MLQMNTPKLFWANAILTATYFWNQMPSRSLKSKSPFEMLFPGKNPFSIPPKSLVVFLLFITTVLIMRNLILVLISAFFSVILVLRKNISATALPYVNTLSVLMWHSLWMSHIILLKKDSYRNLYFLISNKNNFIKKNKKNFPSTQGVYWWGGELSQITRV